MLGGTSIRRDLFQTIRLQIAVAKAAVMQSDPVARSLILLIREGQLTAAIQNPLFKNLLDLLAPSDAEVDLAIELYNGHQWAVDPISQRRNLLAAAAAHFEARKPIDRMQEFTGTGAGTVTQVNSGPGQRISALDVHEHHTKESL